LRKGLWVEMRISASGHRIAMTRSK
jgi:hypothetical protein